MGFTGDRNTMHTSPRCGARTRSGKSCQAPAVQGKRRCRMHGGAEGSGAPLGSRNALKHGFYSAAAKAERRRLRRLLRHLERECDELESLSNDEFLRRAQQLRADQTG